MKDVSKIFYAKVLLFGEYSVIFDSQALTIPFGHFSGEISYINKNRYTDHDFAIQSNKDLRKFGQFIRELHETNKLGFIFDFDRFEKNLNEGLFFESNIPMGYGLGSSGALCAGLYDAYALDKIPAQSSVSPEMLSQLKHIFQGMESFFHGKSSGLDPLNCYFGTPMLLDGKDKISFIDIPKSPINHAGAIFLINTGKSSKTGPLVELFMEKVKEDQFEKVLFDKLIPLTNSSISSLLSGQSDLFFKNLKELSSLQLEHFRPMIPSEFISVWEEGLKSEKYYLKLCGSGGGGFLLGFTKDFQQTREFLQALNIDPVPVYREDE
jgi:mevalonate kinase